MFENQWNKKESPLSTLVGLGGGATGWVYIGDAASSQKKYVEDVFNTYVYKGDGSAETITHDIDLADKGGMIWMKSRTQSGNHALWSSELFGYDDQAWGSYQSSNLDVAGSKYYTNQSGSYPQVTSTSHTTGWFSTDNEEYVNWTFRKAQGFFDVVKYQGNNNVAQSINHNLGCVPGCIIVKNISAGETEDWVVYHKNLSSNTEGLKLNLAAGENGSDWWNSTSPTSTQFTVGTMDATNKDTDDYIAYLFADGDDTDAQIFGDNENESIIKCGSVNIGGSGTYDVDDLGWEPQYVLMKKYDNINTVSDEWYIYDNMREFSHTGRTYLEANKPDDETSWDIAGEIFPYAKGFKSTASAYNAGNYIYMAIRRGPMKIPTNATKVFEPVTYTGTSGIHTVTISPSYTDLTWIKHRTSSTDAHIWVDRLRSDGNKYVSSDDNSHEGTLDANSLLQIDKQNGFSLVGSGSSVNTSGQTYISYNFKRAPGFFDIVCYTSPGTSPDPQVYNHNLSVEPELIIVKNRDDVNHVNWVVWQTSWGTSNLSLNTDEEAGTLSARIEGATPTTFSVGTQGQAGGIVNGKYVAYLFASCPGVSSVGTYTGNGTSKDIICDFTGGARFIMIKRTDDDGDWIVYDKARGLGVGLDYYLRANLPNTELTYDDIDTLSTGFTVKNTGATASGQANILNATYIYLAIA